MLPETAGKAVAGIVAGALHAGLAVWVLRPEPPVVLPQQSVMQVRMVAPPAPVKVAAPEPPRPQHVIPAAPTPPPLPPKVNGMKKAEKPKTPPRPAVQRPPAKAPVKKTVPQKPLEKTIEAASALPSAAPAAAAPEPSVSQPLFDAAYLQNPPPAYPSMARRRRIEGTVLLHVDVSASGEAVAVTVSRSSGSYLLDEAARDAVRRWRFVPARRGSETVAAGVRVPVQFQLN